MKKYQNIFALLVIALIGLSLTACSEDDLDTNQYVGGVSLNVYGPNPVMRGGTLRFLGSNLDQIASIQIPGVSAITNINVVQSGIPSEIRVTVPENYPTPGLVTLTTKTGEIITTKTELNYIEGVEITSVTAAAMPGDKVTITGDYLNLVFSLAFANNVIIGESDFVTHDRYTIEVIVPDDAKTGKIELYTADLTVIDKSSVEYQIITTDNAIEIGVPSISKLKGRNEAEALGEITAKAGEKITINGTYFNVAADVTIGGVSAKDLSMAEDGTNLVFTLPAEAPSGDIMIICKSGVEVPVGTLTTVKPTEGVATPNPVKAGQALTVSGKDMDVVTAVTFPAGESTVDASEITVSADNVVVKAVPETATEGNLALVMANGESVEVAFTLVKPTVTGYDNVNVSAGGALTILGTNLDLVKTVQFGEGSTIIEVESTDGATIALTTPMDAISGAPTLTLANGTTIENVPSITIEEAVFCYITELPTDENKPEAGALLTVPVKNGDKLTNVYVNGTEVNFVYNEKASEVSIAIPSNAKASSSLKLVSSNGEIEYTIPVLPNTEIYTTIWQGAWECAGWGGNQDLAWGGFDWSTVTAGTMLEIHLTKTNQGSWGCISLRHGAGWGALPAPIPGQYDLEDGNIVLSIELTQAILDDINGNGGLVITGDNYILSKVVLHEHIDLETAIWSGSWDCSGWGGNQDLAWGGFDWTTVKTNSTVRFYYTKITAGAWGCISLRHGAGWGALPDPIPGQYDFPDDSGVIEVVFPANVLQDIIDNGGLVITGDNYTLTKVTIE